MQIIDYVCAKRVEEPMQQSKDGWKQKRLHIMPKSEGKQVEMILLEPGSQGDSIRSRAMVETAKWMPWTWGKKINGRC